MPLGYVYPVDLDLAKHAAIRFVPDTEGAAAAQNQYGNSITLFCPPGVSFADGAVYNEFDLGIIAEKEAELVDTFTNIVKAGAGSGLTTGLGMAGAAIKNELTSAWRGVKGVFDEMKNDPSMAGFLAATYYAKMTGQSDLENAISHRSRMAINPRTNILFKGVNVRSFSFNFTLVSESRAEADVIRDIDRTFRVNLYPETVDDKQYILRYPPLWNISFLFGGENDNAFIPSIDKCFLSAFNSTYNPNGSSVHPDGAPIETSFSLSFTESKALTRKDIEVLV